MSAAKGKRTRAAHEATPRGDEVGSKSTTVTYLISDLWPGGRWVRRAERDTIEDARGAATEVARQLGKDAVVRIVRVAITREVVE